MTMIFRAEIVIFGDFASVPTDIRTYRRTDILSYRDAGTHLKTSAAGVHLMRPLHRHSWYHCL